MPPQRQQRELLKAGQKFTRWTVLEDQANPWVTHVRCECECGTKRKVHCDNLLRQGTHSCGCLRADRAAETAETRATHFVKNGEVYGRLTVTNADDRKNVQCQCECGNTTTVPSGSLRTGNTRSCGCLSSSRWSATLKRQHAERGHTGISKHPAYTGWRRIYNSTQPTHHSYDPTIVLHPAWYDANVFCADVTAEIGERPNKSWRLLRRDPKGAFEPGNVMWGDQSTIGRRREHGKFPPDTRREMASMVVDLGFTQVDVAKAYDVLPSYISNVVKAYKTGKL
jgi:hypothetical protein